MKSQPPSSIRRYWGTQIEDSSTIPIRSAGKRSSTPFTIRSVMATAGGTHRKIDSRAGTNESVGIRVEGVVEDAGLVGHMEHRGHTVIDECGPQPIVVRM